MLAEKRFAFLNLKLMSQSVTSNWTTTQHFLFRVFSLYLVLYFLFISDFRGSYPFLSYFNSPFKYLAVGLLRFTDKYILHLQFPGNFFFGDASWTFIALLIFLIVAIVIAMVWTFLDKGEGFTSFYKYIFTFCRYYLACLLFMYGTSKIYGYQFTLIPSVLAQPVGNLDSHDLFWTFMGASKSYRLFAGLIEVMAGILLLFRRTTTLGSITALLLLINILILDIAYDTWVKVIVFHLILFSILILIPDFRRLIQIFVLKQNQSLTTIPPVIEEKKLAWLQSALKVLVIFCMVYVFGISELLKGNREPAYNSLVGIHEISSFTFLQPQQTVVKESRGWKKVVINQFDFLTVQFTNDSIAEYSFEADTASRFLQLRSGRGGDFQCNLHYIRMTPGEWTFEGILQRDSIRFVTRKTEMSDLRLLKGYGKVKWIFD